MPVDRAWMIGAMFFACFPAAAAGMCEARSGTRIAPLVELYTAEGCSDCPPADRWLSALARQSDPGRTSLLAFHVDYWDDIGWPDRFSNPLHGRRQEARVAMAGKKVVYTPQVMVGRETMVDWRNDSRLRSILDDARAHTAPVELLMQVVREQDMLRVGLKASHAQGAGAVEPAHVWLALYQDGLTSAIAAGENKGVTLHHDSVVRVLEGPWKVDATPMMGEVRIPIPAQAEPARMGLVLFAESADSGAAMQSLNLPFSACMP